MRNLRWFVAVALAAVVPLACGSDDAAFHGTDSGGSAAMAGTAGEINNVSGTNANGGSSTTAGSSAIGGAIDPGLAGAATAGAADVIAGAPGAAGAPGMPDCKSDLDCGGQTPICDTSGTCVACIDSSSCSGGIPYCDAATNTCVECQLCRQQRRSGLRHDHAQLRGMCG